MITKRIIPCLDVRNGRVVKGVNFDNLNDVSSPVELGKYYSDCGADELVFYDITASSDGRKLFTDILTEVASKVFIPLTVGGGINTIEDFDRVLKCGADKVSVNSGAIKNPKLIEEAAKKYGNQCVVISADVKRVDGVFRVFSKGGRENTGMEAISWVCLLSALLQTVLWTCWRRGRPDSSVMRMLCWLREWCSLQPTRFFGSRCLKRPPKRLYRSTMPELTNVLWHSGIEDDL